MCYPTDICKQWERNSPLRSSDVCGTGTYDKPLRTSAREAKVYNTKLQYNGSLKVVLITTISRGPNYSCSYELLKIIKSTCAFVDKSVSAPVSFTHFDTVRSRVPEVSTAFFVEGDKRVLYVRWICYNFVKKFFAQSSLLLCSSITRPECDRAS